MGFYAFILELAVILISLSVLLGEAVFSETSVLKWIMKSCNVATFSFLLLSESDGFESSLFGPRTKSLLLYTFYFFVP